MGNKRRILLRKSCKQNPGKIWNEKMGVVKNPPFFSKIVVFSGIFPFFAVVVLFRLKFCRSTHRQALFASLLLVNIFLKHLCPSLFVWNLDQRPTITPRTIGFFSVAACWHKGFAASWALHQVFSVFGLVVFSFVKQNRIPRTRSVLAIRTFNNFCVHMYNPFLCYYYTSFNFVCQVFFKEKWKNFYNIQILKFQKF